MILSLSVLRIADLRVLGTFIQIIARPCCNCRRRLLSCISFRCFRLSILTSAIIRDSIFETISQSKRSVSKENVYWCIYPAAKTVPWNRSRGVPLTLLNQRSYMKKKKKESHESVLTLRSDNNSLGESRPRPKQQLQACYDRTKRYFSGRILRVSGSWQLAVAGMSDKSERAARMFQGSRGARRTALRGR